jgi:hypothetical protein
MLSILMKIMSERRPVAIKNCLARGREIRDRKLSGPYSDRVRLDVFATANRTDGAIPSHVYVGRGPELIRTPN